MTQSVYSNMCKYNNKEIVTLSFSAKVITLTVCLPLSLPPAAEPTALW